MKRAPTKKRLALILDRQSNVAGFSDDRSAWHSVQMYEEGADERVAVPLDGEDSPELEDVLAEMGVTDIIAKFYEDRILGQLTGEGFALWLAPPETTPREAVMEWHEDVLTRAEAGDERIYRGRLRHVTPIERRTNP